MLLFRLCGEFQVRPAEQTLLKIATKVCWLPYPIPTTGVA